MLAIAESSAVRKFQYAKNKKTTSVAMFHHPNAESLEIQNYQHSLFMNTGQLHRQGALELNTGTGKTHEDFTKLDLMPSQVHTLVPGAAETQAPAPVLKKKLRVLTYTYNLQSCLVSQ